MGIFQLRGANHILVKCYEISKAPHSLSLSILVCYLIGFGTKGRVPVSFSGGCLYSNPPLYRHRQWGQRTVYSVYTQCSGCRQPGRQLGTSLYFPLFMPDLPTMKWIHNTKTTEGSANMFVKLFMLPVYSRVWGSPPTGLHFGPILAY